MIFNPKESLSFNGNTGPYLQYTTSRISSMLRKAAENPEWSQGSADLSLLTAEEEWEVLKTLGDFPRLVEQAGEDLAPSLITGGLYQIAKSFSRFYHDLPVLNAGDPELVKARIGLSEAVLKVMKEGFELINLPFLDKM